MDYLEVHHFFRECPVSFCCLLSGSIPISNAMQLENIPHMIPVLLSVLCFAPWPWTQPSLVAVLWTSTAPDEMFFGVYGIKYKSILVAVSQYFWVVLLLSE